MSFARDRIGGLVLAILSGLALTRTEAATFENATDGLLKEVQRVASKEKDQNRKLFFDTVNVPKEGTEAGLRKEFLDRIQLQPSLKSMLVEKKLEADLCLDLTLEKDTDLTHAVLKVRLRNNGDGKEFATLRSEAIDTVEDLTRLLNFTVNQRVTGDDKSFAELTNREKLSTVEKVVAAKRSELKKAFTTSSVQISKDGFRASAGDSSPYQIEIRTQDEEGKFKVSQPIKIIRDSSGNEFAFVDLPLKTVFAVRILNAQKDHDIGARVLLDGINSLELCEIADYKEHGCWLVRKNEAGTIKGWLVNQDLTRSFETSSLADGLITTLKQTNLSSVGTITVSFFPAWSGDDPQPAVEKTSETRAVKPGNAIPNSVNTVSDVHFGKTLLSSVTIRYERPSSDKGADPVQAKR